MPMKSDIAKRIVVILLGVPGIILLLWVGGLWFAALITLAMLLALREFYLISAKKGASALLWVGWVITLLIAWMYYGGVPPGNSLIFYNIFIVGFILTIELFRNKPNPTWNISITIFGIVYISLFLGSLIALRNWDDMTGFHLTWGVFISVWICDTAAYLAGKKWGKKKMMERVSPNKTVVGCIAGVFGAAITYVIMYTSGFLGNLFDWGDIIVFAVISGIFGQIGDFVQSLIKRDMEVKDSGKFLLGHGGVFDRFDSLFFAAPLTYIYLQLFVL